MTQTYAKTVKQKYFSMVRSTSLLILNISYLHHIHCKNVLPQHNHVGEPLCFYDDVTSCGDVSLRAVYSCAWEVRNKC